MPASQSYPSTSGMPTHLRWSRRSHTAEGRRLFTDQTGKATTIIVEILPIQTKQAGNRTASSNSAETVPTYLNLSVSRPTTPVDTASDRPTWSRTALASLGETAPVQSFENSAELALNQINLIDSRTMSFLPVVTESVYSTFLGSPLTINFSNSKSTAMSEKKSGEKRQLTEEDEGESLVVTHTQNTFLLHFWATSNPIALHLNLLSPGMEVDQERKRAREGTSEEEASETLLGEEGKLAAKLSRQERADDTTQEPNALRKISRQRKQRALPRVLFVLKFNGNILPALIRTPAQTISYCSSLGSLVAQAAMGAEEEEQLLNEEGEGTSRRRRTRRTPFDQLTPEQQARRRETVRLKNLRKKERRRQNKLSTTDSPGTSADVPAPATKPSSSASQTKPDPAPSQPNGQRLLPLGRSRNPQSFIKTRLAMGKEAGGSAQPVRIRDSRLVSGRVEVTVWDKPSEQFVMRAVGGLEVFSTGAGVGTATFFFNLPSYWHYEEPDDLIQILQADNPMLPSGALTFVSWTARGPAGRRVYVSVNREGIAVLRDLNFTLNTLFGTLKLSPAAD
ncbi:hypothetical protein ACHWQZ_G010823 [Mnemiopsis leidyi]